MRPVQEGGPEPFRAVAVRRQPEGCLFCRWCLDTALSRPVTALDNERFTVQSVMLHYAVPVVLVGEGLQGRGEGRHPRREFM